MVNKILKFSASWCVPCKMYARTFEEVSKNNDFKDIIFEEVDIEENDELTEKYKIRSVPTTVIIDENENILHIFSGNVSKLMLEEQIKKFKYEKCDNEK